MAQAWTARKGKKPRDWASLFDGETRVIRRGTDFECKATSMLVQLRMKAPQYGGRVTGQVVEGDPDAVCYRFVKKAPKIAAKRKGAKR